MTDMPNIREGAVSRNSGITQLDAEMRQLLAEMTLLSYGRTSNWDPKSNGGKPGAVILSSRMTGSILHDYWAQRYADQRNDRGRREVVDAAREELQEVRVQRERPVGETDAQKRKRCVRDCRGMPAGEAATAMRESTRWVMSARKEQALDPSYGEEIVLITEDWVQVAREMRERHSVSFRVIGQRVGKDAATVMRALRRVA